MTPEEKRLLKTVSDARGEATSSFIRRSILKELATLNFLPYEQTKALGLQTNSTQTLKHEIALHGQHNKNVEAEDESKPPSVSSSPPNGEQVNDTHTS